MREIRASVSTSGDGKRDPTHPRRPEQPRLSSTLPAWREKRRRPGEASKCRLTPVSARREKIRAFVDCGPFGMGVSRAAIMQAERCGIWILARRLACYCRSSCLGVISSAVMKFIGYSRHSAQ